MVDDNSDGAGLVDPDTLKKQFDVTMTKCEPGDPDCTTFDENQLKSIKGGLYLLQRTLGEKPPMTIRPSLGGGYTDYINQIIDLGMDLEGLALTAQVLHEGFHLYTISANTEEDLINAPFIENMGWQTMTTPPLCFPGLTEPKVSYTNPGTGPTEYSRRSDNVPANDAADTFTAMIVPDFAQYPVTQNRIEWFYWFLSH
jgi:hypothetical protein